MKTHQLGRLLIDGPDVPAVVPTYDDQDRELRVEVRSAQPLPPSDIWLDAEGTPQPGPTVEIIIADD